MDGYNKTCPQLLDLIPKNKEWVSKSTNQTGHNFSEERKLELSLGPPGGEWTITTEDNSSAFGSFLHLQSKMAVMKNVSQACEDSGGKKNNNDNDGANNSAQKRTAPAPVVGWPPIRSFRKNIASGSCSKLSSGSPVDVGPNKLYGGGPKPAENCGPKGLFVKINMDGVPIGRKVDLKTYDSYDKLSYAVDELFRDLLAAQSDSCAGGMIDKKDEEKVIGCLMDGSGEYTLVYEDNEGDRMLVGDVPWHMFVSTVKRLRVLKSSELASLSCGRKHGKLSLND